jgi:hypothetical protein
MTSAGCDRTSLGAHISVMLVRRSKAAQAYGKQLSTGHGPETGKLSLAKPPIGESNHFYNPHTEIPNM